MRASKRSPDWIPCSRRKLTELPASHAGKCRHGLMDKDPSELSDSILNRYVTAGQWHCRRCAPGETRTPNLLIRSWDAPLLMAGIQAFHRAPQSPKWAFPVMVCSSSWIGSWMKITIICPLWTSGDDKLAAKKCHLPRPPSDGPGRWPADTRQRPMNGARAWR
jgi:hypothetical protein